MLPPDAPAPAAGSALDPAAAAAAAAAVVTPALDAVVQHADLDSDDDEALRLRNEQDGQMILEMDSDNVLLQVSPVHTPPPPPASGQSEWRHNVSFTVHLCRYFHCGFMGAI